MAYLIFGGQWKRVSDQLMEKWLALSGPFCMYTEICTLIELEQSFIVRWLLQIDEVLLKNC